MVHAGAAGLSVIDVLLTGLREATGASGATFIEFGPEDGRVIVGNGAMTWSTGQPVVDEVARARRARHVVARHAGCCRAGSASCCRAGA